MRKKSMKKMKNYIRTKTLRTIKSSDELNKKERKKNTRIISENKKMH